MKDKKPRRRLTHENRLTWLTACAAGPAIVIALIILWFGDYSPKVQWTLTLIIAAFSSDSSPARASMWSIRCKP